MTDCDEIFDDDYTLHRCNMTACWEHIGEGLYGNYRLDDPDDVALWRFTVYKDGEMMDDASYCTLMPVDMVSGPVLRKALQMILDAASKPSPKRELELLSWMKPEDFGAGGRYAERSIRV